jgi:phage-related holin
VSVFEILMLVCFGAAWPLSIYKSYTARRNSGKSLWFMIVIVCGYIAGILHKIVYSYDAVIFLYILNFLMVSTDICLYFRNSALMKKEQGEG